MSKQRKKTYVSVRIDTAKSGQLNHDTRNKKEDYVRDNIENIYLDDNFTATKINNTDEDKINKLQSYLYQRKQKHFAKMKSDANQYNKRAIQRTTKLEISGMISFSDTMRKDYEKNPDDFKKRTIEMLKEFAEIHNTKILNSSIHLDEKTPHIHFAFLNYDFKNHRTLKRTLHSENLEDLQDFGEKYWLSYGVGYERGEKVSKTGNKHLSVRDSHKVEEFKNQLDSVIKNYKSSLYELEELRRIKREEIKLKEDNSQDKIILKQLTENINAEKRRIKLIENYMDKSINKNFKFFGGKGTEGIKEDVIKLFSDSGLETKSLEKKLDSMEKAIQKISQENEQLKIELEEERYDHTKLKSNIITQNIDMQKIKNDNLDLQKGIKKLEADLEEVNSFINANPERKSQYEKWKELRKTYQDKKKDTSTSKDLTPSHSIIKKRSRDR